MKKQIISPYFCLEDLVMHPGDIKQFIDRLIVDSKTALELEGVKIEKQTFDRNPDPITNPRGTLARMIYDCEIPEEKSDWKLFVSSKMRKEDDKNVIDSEFYFTPEAQIR